MPPLEGDEEVKEGKGLLSKQTRIIKQTILILLAQIKGEKNSNTLKNEIRQILHLLYQHNKMTKSIYNNLVKSLEENMTVIRAPKTFLFLIFIGLKILRRI